MRVQQFRVIPAHAGIQAQTEKGIPTCVGMTKALIVSALLLPLPLPAFANTITATVDGMVCAFCAKGIEDKLKENGNVDTVKISMDDASVTVTSKKGTAITPDTVKKAVDYMGFTVREIREDK